MGGLDGEGKVGARLPCTGIGGAPENAFEQLQRPAEAHRVHEHTCDLQGGSSYKTIVRIFGDRLY